jgi:hypothetical protein
MTRLSTVALIALAAIIGAPALATREPTAAPVYYLIDYGHEHLDNPEYIEWVRELPPELLHFGKDVPMTHLYGPIAAVGGENQAHGRNREDIRRLTPDEVQARIEALQRMNAALHEAGVGMIMPYTSSITFAGDPDTREGFFDFWDHWDEYLRFGIGPRPDDPPENWPAIKADGSLHTFGKLLQPEYYAGLYRYVACIENPAWRNWLVQVHRLVALAGYDGAFPDNTSPINCYGPHCQQAFRRYLAEKFTPAQLHELLGDADVAKLELPKEKEGLVWVEANRFWRTSLAEHVHAMREGGRQVNPDFKLFPNLGGPLPIAEYLVGHADYFMAEGGRGPQGAGCLVKPVIGDIVVRDVMDNILDYRYYADIPGDTRPMLLKLGRTESARKLCIAEAAAFGSGAYNGVRPSSRDLQRPYIEFLLDHKDLYAGKVSTARVAMPFYPMRMFYPGSGHYGAAFTMKDRLGSMQIPFDFFSEGGLELDVLRTYDAFIVPELRHVSDDHLRIIRDYVDGGGILIIVGDFATHDELCRERATPGWLPGPGERRSYGRGTIVHFDVNPTRTDLLRALEPVGEMRLVVAADRMNRPMLRAMAYRDDEEYIVHLLNYSCPVEAGFGENVPERDVTVRVPLEDGQSVASVTCYDPEAQPTEADFEVRDGACWFTVREVPIYVVCRVEIG